MNTWDLKTIGQRQAEAISSYVANLTKVQICVALFLFALVLRAIGMHYGFWNGDERVNDAAKVLTGKLVPDQHFYPPLFNYILASAFALLYAVGRLIPVWSDTTEFRNHYFSDPTAFYLTARFVTACLGAAVAPLFYLICKEIGIRRWPAIAAGIIGAMIPVNVLLSHTAKSDVPLATMVIATFYVLLLIYRSGHKDILAALLGLVVSLAFSFKHSYIFLALPLGLWHLYWLAGRYERIELVRSIAISAATFIVSWVVFNIGIVLDLENFLTYQAIQSEMSIRESDTATSGIATWASLAADIGNGITPIGVLLYFAFPAILLSGLVEVDKQHQQHLLAMWASLLFAMIVIIYLVGSRQPPGLWLPLFTGMQLFAVLTVVLLISFSKGLLKLAGIAGLTLLVMWSAVGDGVVLKQALARPVSTDVSSFVQKNYAGRNIVTWSQLDIPQTKEGQQLEIKRAEKLAQKYEIELPPVSEENILKSSPPGAVNYIQGPMVMHGLEGATDESLKGVVKAYAWPLQAEEWSVDYWTDKGFDLFVTASFQLQSARMRTFLDELGQRCERASEFAANKPLYIEHSVTIFDCANLKPSP